MCVCVYFHTQVSEVGGSSEGPPRDGLDEVFTQVPEKQGNRQKPAVERFLLEVKWILTSASGAAGRF